MLLLIWTVVGMILGFIWGLITWRSSLENFARIILLSVIGAVTGGLLFMIFGTSSWTGINAYNLVVPTAGALTILTAYHSFKQSY